MVDINSREEYDEVRTNPLLRDHAIFIGYAPYDNPRYSIAVIVENGESGGRIAGPIAIGPAILPPLSPFSTITAIEYRGLSYGA